MKAIDNQGFLNLIQQGLEQVSFCDLCLSFCTSTALPWHQGLWTLRNMHTLQKGRHLFRHLEHVYRHVIQCQKSNMLHKTTVKTFKTMNYQIQALSSWLLWAVFLQLSSTVPWCYERLPSFEACDMTGTEYSILDVVPIITAYLPNIPTPLVLVACTPVNSIQFVWSSLRAFSLRSSSRSQHR